MRTAELPPVVLTGTEEYMRRNVCPGLYRVYWKNAKGFSLAAAGIDKDGNSWLAPTNWVNGSSNLSVWERVERLEPIVAQPEL